VGWKTVQSETVLPDAPEVTVTVIGGKRSVIVDGGKTGPAGVQLGTWTTVEVIVIVDDGGPKVMVEPGTVTVEVETEPGAVETDVSVTVKALQVPWPPEPPVVPPW
jgi:hypothetical protein